VVRRRDDDGVDVLVVEDAAQILRVARLERRDVAQPRVIDPLRREVPVDVAQRFDLDVLELGESAFQRVALTADADARGDDAIVGADYASTDERCSVEVRFEEAAADGDACGCRPDADREFPPRNAVLLIRGCGHGDVLP